MARVELTQSQKRAVSSTDRSVLVSAAAGSGKTSVLARRCAYLVCDAPQGKRCDVDALLVVTFTDAAAAEMRSRIGATIRQRAEQSPTDDRLREQSSLVETAHISTIHAFCMWIIRRWFNEAGVDPTATVMDADEAQLARHEILETLFEDEYAKHHYADDPLGAREDVIEQTENQPGQSGLFDSVDANKSESLDRVDQPKQMGLLQLVDDYGLGYDRSIAEFVLRLAAFLDSLPDPDAWTDETIARHEHSPHVIVFAHYCDLVRELRWQADYCAKRSSLMRGTHEACVDYADQIALYESRLREWADRLEGLLPNGHLAEPPQAIWGGLDALRREMDEFSFARTKPYRTDDEEAKTLRERAGTQFKKIRDTLLRDRVKERFTKCGPSEWFDGLRRTAPYVRALVDITRQFRDRYAAYKRKMGYLDFADLERFAYEVLHDGSPTIPSAVARALQRRFKYVLVDEFQDINPLQESILHLVSKESCGDSVDNLFVVGDVKQSIYRFRLAEPGVFLERLRHGTREGANADVVFLKENFRSRSEVLDAVNLVFERLMHADVAGVEYDENARLHAGRFFEDTPERKPVEFHLLERRLNDAPAVDEDGGAGTSNEDGREKYFDPSDPVQWSPIEREAYLIAIRIKEMMQTSANANGEQSLRYGDIAVLLRATKVNAEQVAGVLTTMNVPAQARVGGSLLDCLEVRDVLAALEVLDNMQQDIPLAAALRSGVFGVTFSEDDLVEIRALDRIIPFHQVILAYTNEGEDVELRERLVAMLRTIDRYREVARCYPLSELLWRLYDETGYFAYAGGLPGGRRRRANLLRLHDRARQFDTFRRQGLYRFLRFIRLLESENRGLVAALPSGESKDAVSVISIHQSKGLEFPIVFVAGLGTRFNLVDRGGQFVYARCGGVALRGVNPEKMVEFPTVAHNVVCGEVERETRAEELRVLYVAMTRARDRLILIGSTDRLPKLVEAPRPPQQDRVAPFELALATTPLDWLISALGACSPNEVSWFEKKAGNAHTVALHAHDSETIRDWAIDAAVDDSSEEVIQRASRGEPLPDLEPMEADDPAVESLFARLDFTYPETIAASIPAVRAASEFKREFDFPINAEFPVPEEIRHRLRSQSLHRTLVDSGGSDRQIVGLNSASEGVITHRALQYMDFGIAADSRAVASELQRLVQEAVISEQDAERVNQGSLAWFLGTPLADKIRLAGGAYRREFAFIHSRPASDFDSAAVDVTEQRVLVRGIVDGVLPGANGMEIVDYKTDAITVRQLRDRAESYREQMRSYATAMQAIWEREVVRCHLVFLTGKEIVTLDAPV